MKKKIVICVQNLGDLKFDMIFGDLILHSRVLLFKKIKIKKFFWIIMLKFEIFVKSSLHFYVSKMTKAAKLETHKCESN